MEDAVLSTFLVVDYELDGDTRIVRESWLREAASVTRHVPGVAAVAVSHAVCG
jgi:hypothetical protein